jgi:hypothetical protein
MYWLKYVLIWILFLVLTIMKDSGVHFGRPPSVPGFASASMEALETLSLTQLRTKARKTHGVTERKKIGVKWVPKDRSDFLAEFKALEATAAGAQPLASSAAVAQKSKPLHPRLGISPRLRQLHRELSGTSDDSGEDTVAKSLPQLTEEPGCASASNTRGPGSASPDVRYGAEALGNMSKTKIRVLAAQTPGVSVDKKTPEGKWTHKTKAELVADLLAVFTSTQSLTGGCSATAKKQSRLEHQRTRKKSEKYKLARSKHEKSVRFRAKARLKERAPKFRLAQNTRRKQESYKVRKRLYEDSPKESCRDCSGGGLASGRHAFATGLLCEPMRIGELRTTKRLTPPGSTVMVASPSFRTGWRSSCHVPRNLEKGPARSN